MCDRQGILLGFMKVIHLFILSFAVVIFDNLWKSFLEDLRAAQYLSVLADSTPDVSVHNLEGIYIRMLKYWKLKNVFLAVEELHNSTAVGHCAALNTRSLKLI